MHFLLFKIPFKITPSSVLPEKVGATVCAPFFSRSSSKEMTSHPRVAQKYHPSLSGCSKAFHLLSAGSTMIILSQLESVFHNPAILLIMSPVLMAFTPCSSQQRKMKSKKTLVNSVIFLIFLPGNLYNTEFQED